MLIRISIERTQPLAGAAATEGGDVPFDGWLELLRVVSRLVAAASSEDVQVMDQPQAGKRTRKLTGKGADESSGRRSFEALEPGVTAGEKSR